MYTTLAVRRGCVVCSKLLWSIHAAVGTVSDGSCSAGVVQAAVCRTLLAGLPLLCPDVTEQHQLLHRLLTQGDNTRLASQPQQVHVY